MRKMREAAYLGLTLSIALGFAGAQTGCGGGGGPAESENSSHLGLSLLAGALGGAGNVDGVGTDARFNYPAGVASDGTNLYIADRSNNTIRKLVISSGVVTTIAGTPGAAGSADGTGAAARFDRPLGLAMDGANLLIADSMNHTIRKLVLSSGVVTTLAGSAGSSGSSDGTGSAARFDRPWGIASDGTNVFIADYGNHTIRKLVIASGVVSTLAGLADTSGTSDGPGSTARFYAPSGVATDGTNVYVADQWNNTIRKIEISLSTVTTLAGSAGSPGSADGTGSAARFDGPYGIATDGASLFVTEVNNRTVRRVVISTAGVSTLAGSAGVSGSADGVGSTARFNRPQGIAWHGTHLFVTEDYNYTVRKIEIAEALVTTVAGKAPSPGSTDGTGAAARFLGPQGVATDGTNAVVADGDSIRKIAISSGVVTTLAAGFNGPFGVATDGTRIFVANTGNNTVDQILISSGAVTTLAGSSGEDGSQDGVGSAARFSGLYGIATDGTNVFVSDYMMHTIRKIVISSGVVTTLAGSAGSSGSADGIGSAARFYSPFGLASDGGYVFVAEGSNHTIRRVEIATGIVTTIAGQAGTSGSSDGVGAAARFKSPTHVAVDGATLYVADTGNYTVRRIDLVTGSVSTPIGMAGAYGTALGALPARLSWVTGIAVAGGKLILAPGEYAILIAPAP